MDKINEKAKQIVADCHERGMPVAISIADIKSGISIRAMDGQLYDILNLMAIQFIQLSEQSGNDLGEMVDAVKKAAKAMKEDLDAGEKKKGGKNGKRAKSNTK